MQRMAIVDFIRRFLKYFMISLTSVKLKTRAFKNDHFRAEQA
jgi:hypothetical protein